ncbi:MAG: sulfatase [Deltaproteobacteria bacterium]|nr:sulfatase [Deltaproteobacteria bacterium]
MGSRKRTGVGWAVPAAILVMAGLAYAGLLLTRDEGPIAGVPPRPGRTEGALDVVLVVVDTQRADFTSVLGSRLRTTPFLERLASRGILFTRAYAPGPWTVPSMYSVMTGLYPSEHGMITGWSTSFDAGGQNVLPDEAVTLAERLDGAGFETFGVCTNFHVSRRFGFGQGFDRFVGEDFTFMPFPNMAVTGLADDIAASPMYFLWLHYLDPHFPYFPHWPWFEQFNESSMHSYDDLMTSAALEHYYSLEGNTEGMSVRAGDVAWVNRTAKLLQFRPIALFEHMRENDVIPHDEWVEFLSAAYASEIRMVDSAMEEALTELGVDDRTILVVTSDHGEELFDHGGHGHRMNDRLYEELIHVPLLFVLPGGWGAGTVVDTPVSLVDIVPTLLDLLGLEVPADLSGLSLLPLMQGQSLPERPLYAEVASQSGVKRCIIEYPWKYIHDFGSVEGELYDLEADPAESRDLVDLEPERAAALREKLLAWYKGARVRWQVGEPPELSQEDFIRLKLLGYIE